MFRLEASSLGPGNAPDRSSDLRSLVRSSTTFTSSYSVVASLQWHITPMRSSQSPWPKPVAKSPRPMSAGICLKKSSEGRMCSETDDGQFLYEQVKKLGAPFATTARLKPIVHFSLWRSTISCAKNPIVPAHCIAFVAIRSMLFSDSEQLLCRREIFTMICTVRCKKSRFPLKTTASLLSLPLRSPN
jgi:hypothetical protein